MKLLRIISRISTQTAITITARITPVMRFAPFIRWLGRMLLS